MRTCPAATRESEEEFNDGRLLRVWTSLFVTGRPLLANVCKQLVLDQHESGPSVDYSVDAIKRINQKFACLNAPTLRRHLMMEYFCLEDLVERNCMGRVNSESSKGKEALDQMSIKFIHNSVFGIYPEMNEKIKLHVWAKCVDKIYAGLGYIFTTCLSNHKWLKIEL